MRGTAWRSCFFFQAEDGIRDYKVTGVQTCALPISSLSTIIDHARRTLYLLGMLERRSSISNWGLDTPHRALACLRGGSSQTLLSPQQEIGRASCRERV